MSEITVPRREVLEARLRKLMLKTQAVREQHRQQIEDLRQQKATILWQMNWHASSQQKKDLLTRAENIPPVPGVYAITVNGNTVYVGESVNVKARCVSHVKMTNAVGQTEDVPPLYFHLATVDPTHIDFHLVKEVLTGKTDRLAAEAEHIAACGDDGFLLFNVANNPNETRSVRKKPKSGPKPKNKRPVTSMDEWHELLSYMSPALRDENYYLDDV